MREFSASQKLRLRLYYLWKNTPRVQRKFDAFEDFYQDFIQSVSDNLDMLVKTLEI
jgi:hypothetical protein